MLLLFVVLESPSRVTGMPPEKYFDDPCTGCAWAECVPEAAPITPPESAVAMRMVPRFCSLPPQMKQFSTFGVPVLLGEVFGPGTGIIGSQPAKPIPPMLVLAAVMMVYPICIWPPSIFSTAEDFREPISLLMTRDCRAS